MAMHGWGLVVGSELRSLPILAFERELRVIELRSGLADAWCLSSCRSSVVVRGRVEQLPFSDERFEVVALVDCLHNVVDEQSVLDEAARVLRPGGRLLLRVPQAGPLGWLDARNLYRYVQYVTNRGENPPTMVGENWHRHYRRVEIERLLQARDFRLLQTTGTGLGLGEPLDLFLLLLFCYFSPSRRRYLRVHRLVRAIERVDDRLQFGAGRYLTVLAERMG
jgi:SAM-dependent methyltransferase